MLNLVTFAIILVVAHAISLENQWHKFKVTHGKSYKSFMEEMSRFIIFQDNVREIEHHNEKFAKGEVFYRKGINRFADMTQEEFEATLSPLPPLPLSLPQIQFNISELVGAREQDVDWVKKGVVTPVRDQGECNSCWAFTAAGTIESQVMIKKGRLVMLSPQNLVDCSREGWNNGCTSGLPHFAFDYVKKEGILTEEEYPYVAKKGPCRKRGGQKISSYVSLPNDERKLLIALTNVGPISIAIDAHKIQAYNSGIIDPSCGCTNMVNHAVILVGSGVEDGKKYWLFKNSWGTKWGLNGYGKILRGEEACGMGKMGVYPVL